MLKRVSICLLLPLCICVGGSDLSPKNQKRFQDYTVVKYQNYQKKPKVAKASAQNVLSNPAQRKRQMTYSEPQPIKNPNAVKKQMLSTAQGVRVYKGCVKKFGFFKSRFYKIDYGLHQGNKCIACLKADNLLLSTRLKHLEGKTVIVKGSLDYINKEPFLVISVKEICEQEH